jgi:hypothetical protein
MKLNKEKEAIIDNCYESYKKKQQKYSEYVIKLSENLSSDIKDLSNVQAEVISLRQMLIDDMMSVYYVISKLIPKNKILKKERFEFYVMEYQIKKLTATEKIQLIEADLAYQEQLIQCHMEHVEYLKETIKNTDNLNFSIKNKIEISNIIKETRF